MKQNIRYCLFKKTIYSFLFASLVACGNEQAVVATASQSQANVASQVSSSVATPAQQENIIVGAEIAFPPFGFKDQQGQPTGFEIELLKEIAKIENMNLQFLPLKRDTFMEDLQTQQYHIAVAAIAINKERSEKVDLTHSILNYDREIYFLDNEKNQNLKTLADFKGKTLAASRSFNTAQDIVGSADNVIKQETFYLALKAMYLGEVDGVLGDSRALEYFTKQNPEIKTRKISLGEEKRELAFAVKKGNAELLEKLNRGLTTLKENGTYQKLIQEWFE